MVKKAGGQNEADAFARLYLIPGMHHCSGGAGTSSFDMLDVLEQWVEKGIAPASVPASRIVDDKVGEDAAALSSPNRSAIQGNWQRG